MNGASSQWQTEALTRTYLEGVRGAIPLAQAQIEVMLKVVELWCGPPCVPPVKPTGGSEDTLSPVKPTGGSEDVVSPVKPTGGSESALPPVNCVGGSEGLRVLDLGCGDGILGRAILARYPEARLTLVDFSEAMLEAAREKLGPGSRARVVRADFATAGWLDALGRDAAYDLVVSGFSIHHQGDARKRALYAEVYELLRPGGVLLNLEHVASPTPAVEHLFDEYLIDHLYAYHRARDPDASRDEISRTHYHRPDKVENILAPVEVQCDWLRAIGYQDVDCFFKAFELALFGGRKPAR